MQIRQTGNVISSLHLAATAVWLRWVSPKLGSIDKKRYGVVPAEP